MYLIEERKACRLLVEVFGECLTNSEYFKLLRILRTLFHYLLQELVAQHHTFYLPVLSYPPPPTMSKLTKLENEAKTLSEELEVCRRRLSCQIYFTTLLTTISFFTMTACQGGQKQDRGMWNYPWIRWEKGRSQRDIHHFVWRGKCLAREDWWRLCRSLRGRRGWPEHDVGFLINLYSAIVLLLHLNLYSRQGYLFDQKWV